MKINLGGIGKGYAVDRAATILRDGGLSDFMIQSGGDLFVAGRRGDRPWRVGIQDPRGAPDTLFAAELTDAAFNASVIMSGSSCATATDTITSSTPTPVNPRRGAAVSIMAKSATVSDGLSTGVFILGGDAGMALIEKLPDVEGVIVTAENQVWSRRDSGSPRSASRRAISAAPHICRANAGCPVDSVSQG